MQPNPYESPASLSHTTEVEFGHLPPLTEVCSTIQSEIARLGFTSEPNLRIGRYAAMLRCTRNGRHFPIWYTDRVYLHHLDKSTEPSTTVVLDIHAQNAIDAEKFHRRWLRTRMPNTATVILHEYPVSMETGKLIRSKPLPRQAGRPHAIFLFDLVNGKSCFHRPEGLLKSVNHQRSARMFDWLVDLLYEIAIEPSGEPKPPMARLPEA